MLIVQHAVGSFVTLGCQHGFIDGTLDQRKHGSFTLKAHFGLSRMHVHIHFRGRQINVQYGGGESSGRCPGTAGLFYSKVERPILNPPAVHDECDPTARWSMEHRVTEQTGYGRSRRPIIADDSQEQRNIRDTQHGRRHATQIAVSGALEGNSTIYPKRKRNVGPRERELLDDLIYSPGLRGSTAEELAPRRRLLEKILHDNRSTHASRHSRDLAGLSVAHG